MPTRRRSADLWCIVALAALPVLAYRNVTRLWWTFDDPALIAVIRDRPWSELLFGRDLWRHFFAKTGEKSGVGISSCGIATCARVEIAFSRSSIER